MVDIVDESQLLTINIEEVVEEGFAHIVNIDAPSSAAPGEIFNIVIEVKNTGGDDVIFTKIIDTDTGELVSELRTNISGGGTGTFLHQELTMPDRDWNLRIDAGHESEQIPPPPPPGERVIFRQSWLPGTTPSSGDWIAVDTDEDGVLEGYDYTSSTGRFSSPKTPNKYLCDTPEGYRVGFFSVPYEALCVEFVTDDGYYVYKRFMDPSTTAETSSEPTEPYASNGQETYA